jgi:ligand-binding SRPBCC domain-containing protein
MESKAENTKRKELIFQAECWLPAAREKVFAFFSNAENLDRITPDWLKFEILTATPLRMEAGALIDYRIRIRGFPLKWRTRIEVWEPPSRFVDVQVKGPYVLWLHTHTFIEERGGTLCRDYVRYWPRGGRLMDRLFVRRDVERIFEFRGKRLGQIFGTQAG